MPPVATAVQAETPWGGVTTVGTSWLLKSEVAMAVA